MLDAIGVGIKIMKNKSSYMSVPFNELVLSTILYICCHRELVGDDDENGSDDLKTPLQWIDAMSQLNAQGWH